MSDLFVPAGRDDLEVRLADLATALDFPQTPDLATAVGSALRAQAGQSDRRPRVLPIHWRVRRSLLLAAALVLLVVASALAVGFGLRLISIEFGPVPTPVPASSSPRPSGAVGAGLGLGRLLTLEEAEASTAFDLLVPETLGRPDAAYLGGAALRGQVAFVYAPRDDLPVSGLLNGAGLLITQNQGRPDAGLAHKIANSGTATVESVDVEGAPGVWISGEPHLFWYEALDGSVINESRRLVGDTLVWERNGVLYRIEGAITRSPALEIANSMR